MVKNPPAMQETWVQSVGQGDLLEKGMATHFNILAWRSMDCIVHGVAKSGTLLSDFHFHFSLSPDLGPQLEDVLRAGII